MRHETTGKRKIFCIVLCAMLLALSYPAKAQQPNKIPRIGFVSGTDPKNPGPTVEAFQQGLRDRGYVDQQNLVIEYRYGQDMNERSPAVVAELVQLNVDVLVVAGLPAIYWRSDIVEAGGLMSYGVSLPDLDRRAATYVDKILKGSKPADLPVEQPKKFELIINLKAAKQIGVTIPPNVLARADKVIK